MATKFSIHKDFLVAKSKFFEAACSPRWSTDDGSIRLPDTQPEVFRAYLEWIYSDDVEFIRDVEDDVDTPSREQALFCELYLLADTLDDVRLRNKVMEILVKQTRGMPDLSTLKRVYQRTPSNSPFREMLVDRAVLQLGGDEFARTISDYPPEFVQEVAMLLMFSKCHTAKDKLIAKLPDYQETVPNDA